MNLRLEVDASSVLHAFAKAPEATRRHLRIAVQVAAEEVKDQAQKVHDFTSSPNNNLINSVTTELEGDGAKARVYLDSTKAPYGPMLHHGTKPHPILPKNANLTTQRSLAGKFGVPKGSRLVLRWAVGGGFAFARFVNHPGTKPDPFLYDALRAKEERIQALMTDAVQTALREATA